MMNTCYQKRREAVRQKLSEEKLSALLISYPTNRFYLSGFELHDGQCNESSGHILQMEDIRAYLKDKVQGKTGFESKIVSHHFYEHISQGVDLEACDGLVEELRLIKDETEIQALKDSIAINHKLFAWLPSGRQKRNRTCLGNRNVFQKTRCDRKQFSAHCRHKSVCCPPAPYPKP